MLKDRLRLILDAFSQRHTSAGYAADKISETLRNRILLLYREVFSGQWPTNSWSHPGDHTHEFWEQMARSLQHLYGRPKLSDVHTQTVTDDALAFAVNCEAAHFYDFIEQTFKVEAVWRVLSDENTLVEAVNEIFRIENAPYQLTPMVKVKELNPTGSGPYGGGMIIRTVAYPKVVRAEEDVTHNEAVAPALSVLIAPHFEAANLEFRDALDEYRKGQYADCITKCGSTFESVMKVLCKRKKWPVNEQKDTASTLLKTIFSRTQLDPFFEQPLMLIATMRNRLSSSHGGGTTVRNTKRHVAQYAITSTAAAVVLLIHECGD